MSLKMQLDMLSQTQVKEKKAKKMLFLQAFICRQLTALISLLNELSQRKPTQHLLTFYKISNKYIRTFPCCVQKCLSMGVIRRC